MDQTTPADQARTEPSGHVIRDPRAALPNAAQYAQITLSKAAFRGGALWVSLGLIAANVVVYAPVWHHDFINFDDPSYVTENPHVLGGLTWPAVRWAFSTGYMSNWHPLTWLSHMLDVQLYGVNPGPHHLTNLVLHIVNSILLFGLLHRMTGALGRSAFVAALFAIHPLHVESVAWVAERKDVLSTLFWMLALWAYLEYLRQPRLGRYLVMLLLFALGLMAKPMLVTFPFILLLLDYWPLGRVAFGGAPASSARKTRSLVAELVREKLPLFGLVLASSVVTFMVQQRQGAIVGLDLLPWDRRVANALVSYFAYIGKMFLPTRLAVFYPYPRSIPAWLAIGALLGLIVISIVMIRAGRRYAYLPIGWFWYLVTLIPVIGVVQTGLQSMADRYTYVPLIGLFIIMAWGIPELFVHWPYHRIALPVAAALVIAACIITARGQVGYWRSSNALWAHSLEVTPDNFFAHYNLGIALPPQGRASEAIAQYSDVLRLNPYYAEAYNGLGVVLAGEEKFSEAVAQYDEALRLRPDYAQAHYNLGVALAALGKDDEAIAQYSAAVRLDPDYVAAHYNLGNALVRQRRGSEAITQYLEVIRLKPNDAEAHNNLGVALTNQGKDSDAIVQYSEALRLKPDYAAAHYNLEKALERQGNATKEH